MITATMLKMNIKESKTFYFDPPLLDVEAIQLQEMWVSSNSYFIFCDEIDTGFSLANFNDNDDLLKPTNLIGIYPRGLNTIFKTNIISKLTITIKNMDLSKPVKNEVAILSLKIYHDRLNERL